VNLNSRQISVICSAEFN